MNEYQVFAASKAQELLDLMQKIGKVNKQILKLSVSMQPDLEKIIKKETPLPTKVLGGWSYNLSPRDNFNEIFDVYPDLVNAYSELSWILNHASMESYLASRNYLENL
jgi:hypothetical protein